MNLVWGIGYGRWVRSICALNMEYRRVDHDREEDDQAGAGIVLTVPYNYYIDLLYTLDTSCA